MKKVFLNCMLLLCALIVGSNNLWADKITDYTNIVSGKKYYIGATTSSTDYYLSVDGSTTSDSKAGTAVTNKANATVFVFSGSGTAWTIQFDGTSNYLSLSSSKDNGKVKVVSSASTFTTSNKTGKFRLAINNSYSIQKNNSTTNFGSYGNTQTDIWLEEYDDSTPTMSVSPTTIDFGTVIQGASVSSQQVEVSFSNLTDDVSYSGLTAPFTASGSISTTGDKITISADASTIGEYSQTLVVASTDDDLSQSVTVTMKVVAATGNFGLYSYSGGITEGDYVVYYGGYSMKNEISSNRLSYVEVTPAENTISNPGVETIWHIAQNGNYWTIYNDDVSKYAASTGSKGQAKLEASVTDNSKWTVTGTSTYEFENKARAAAASDSDKKWLRNNGTYGFACYASSTGGALSLYKKNSYSIKIPANSWASFAPGSDVTIPNDASLNVYTARLTNPNTLTASKINTESDVKIPARAGVLIKNTSNDVKTYEFEITTGASELSNNDLVGTVVTTAISSLKSANGDYVMVLKKGEMNFIHYTGTNIPANKACVVIPAANVPGAPSIRFVVEEENDATSIENYKQNDNVVKYYQDGQLLIMRSGITYDVMGRIVK